MNKRALLSIILAIGFVACYVHVNLRKYIPEDCSNYTMFIKKDWGGLYAVINDSTEIMRVRNQLMSKANFGIGGYYYCDDVKYIDGLIISKNNFYSAGQCLNGIDFLNIDTMRLDFNYKKHSRRVNKRDLTSMMKTLDSTHTPFFISESDTSKYFGDHVYVFHVTYAKRKMWGHHDKAGNKIEKELVSKTKYKSYEIQYVTTSDTTLQFYFADNDSISRLDSNLRFHNTRSIEYKRYLAETYVINYFDKVK